MTEIQWIIHLMTNCPLDESVKRLCLERIGEVEKKLMQGTVVIPSLNHQPGIGQPPISAAQARDMALSNAIAPQLPPKVVPQEVVQNLGNGTSLRGKRKF